MKLNPFFSKVVTVLGISAVSFLSFSCSTIINGSKQDVYINSSENNATIKIDGNDVGSVPLKIKLRRGQNHMIEISKPGFQTYRFTTTNNLNGWVFGNLLCGGVVGIIVDFASGNAYDIEPDHINATLYKATAQMKNYSTEDFSIFYIQNADGKTIEPLVIEWE